MKDYQQNSKGLLGRFAEWKREITAVLASASKAREDAFAMVHQLGPDALERIISFSSRGKMLRGGLVCLADGLISGEVSADAYVAGAVVELFQSALLIHDDIMDRDLQRRGAPSVFAQYHEMAQRSSIDDAYHLGESLGICAGDVGFFLGFELIAEMGSPPRELIELSALCARELSYVGVAQMADVLRGASSVAAPAGAPFGRFLRTDDPEKAVLDVYRFKTGRYTFSLPLMMGATIGGANKETLGKLQRLGEDLGIVFQLKDDEIGIFGSTAETGKPIGSDIREGKKTLFYVYLMEQAEGMERDRFLSIFGASETENDTMDQLVDAMEVRGIRKRVMEKASQLAESAREIIGELTGFDSRYTSLLRDLVDYNLNRTR